MSEERQMIKELLPVIEMLIYSMPETSSTKLILRGQIKQFKRKYKI